LANFDRELAERFQVFAVKYGRHSKDQTLRTGNGIERAVIEPIDPWHGGTVVKTHHKLSLKGHSP
jgi:hypothetical protein